MSALTHPQSGLAIPSLDNPIVNPFILSFLTQGLPNVAKDIIITSPAPSSGSSTLYVSWTEGQEYTISWKVKDGHHIDHAAQCEVTLWRRGGLSYDDDYLAADISTSVHFGAGQVRFTVPKGMDRDSLYYIDVTTQDGRHCASSANIVISS